MSLFSKPPERIRVTDSRILCECGSDQPMASVLELRSYALRKESNGSHRLISEVTGDRVCCQVCGNVFAIGPHGRFKHHPRALPFVDMPPAPVIRPRGQNPPEEEYVPPDIPLMRARPEV